MEKMESMPQTDDHYDFSLALAKNCNHEALDVIRENRFIRERLRDIKDHHEKTFLHSLEMGNMAAFLIDKLGDKLTEEEKKDLLSSALLHDYGKTSIDPEILDKEDELTQEERLEIEKHPTETFHALKEWRMNVAKISAAHHEHQDRSYPRKDFREINKLSRTLSIIDSFQSMLDPTRPSSKRNPKTIDEIVEELNKKFVLSEDREIVFLLEEYYYEKLKNEKNKGFKEQVH